MNLGWYEILDRISVIQNTLEEYVYNHQEADVELQHLVDSAQEHLNDAYQYAGKKFNESEQQEENK